MNMLQACCLNKFSIGSGTYYEHVAGLLPQQVQCIGGDIYYEHVAGLLPQQVGDSGDSGVR